MTKKHPCQFCRKKDHCCIDQYQDEGLIMVDFHDVKRLCEFTSLPPNKFCNFKKLSKERFDELSEDEKYYLIDRHILVLKKKNLHCFFLNKKNQCIAHPARPNLCRIFPFWYEENNGTFKITRHNAPKDDVCYITKNTPRICKKLFKSLGTSKQELIQVAKEYDHNLEIYQKYKKYLINHSIEEVMAMVFKN